MGFRAAPFLLALPLVGALWGQAPSTQGQDHWAFQPPRSHPLPIVADGLFVRNPVDAWVRAAQERMGISPSPEAPAAKLFRRLSWDLIGLPPTLEELDAFLLDQEAGAYERAVERLLASPRHGEHLARRWLDAARYGDTHGLHLDNHRDIWLYRDWVISAFQKNLPYDQFIVEQIAGDLLESPTVAQRIATGFNRCNVTSAEGGMIEAEYLAKYAMDRVDTVSTVFLGLTVECAKCHDHKYDPISQREYYQLLGFFNSLDEEASDRNANVAQPLLTVPSEEQQTQLAQIERDLEGVARALTAGNPELDAQQGSFEALAAERLQRGWLWLRPTAAHGRHGTQLVIQGDRTVRASGPTPPREVYEIEATTSLRDLRFLRVDALVEPGEDGVPRVGRASHGNIVLTHVELAAAPLEGLAEFTPVALTSAAADWNQPGFAAGQAVDQDPASGWAIAAGVSEDRSMVLALAEPLSYVGGTRLRVRLHFESPYENHTFARFKLGISDLSERGPLTLGPWRRAPAVPGGPGGPTALLDEPVPGELSTTREDVTWEALEAGDEKVHDLGNADHRAHVFERTLQCPSERPLVFYVGSDDAVRVLLDDQVVHQNNARRPVAPDQDRVEVTIPAGEHRLVVKVVNDRGASGFYFRVLASPGDDWPVGLAHLLDVPPEVRTQPERQRLREFFRARTDPNYATLQRKQDALQKTREALIAAFPKTMVSAERPEPRPAHLLERGQYDRPKDIVSRDVPACLPSFPAQFPRNRLGLAQWLTQPGHPLTARVCVNRIWQGCFGVGLVATPEDFGTRGATPSHPELLDWLAQELERSGWDQRHILRLIVTSSTYRQDSVRRHETPAQRDPQNLLLHRGPRFRLDAEEIRDGALRAAGILVDQVGGPSVKPYQPPGVWRAVAYVGSNTMAFARDDGPALWRRSLYTYWKRTAPPSSMQVFDAPSREACVVQRPRTNTPLQALTLLNDEQYVEAARALAERGLLEPGDDPTRLAFLFRIVTSREPAVEEQQVLEDVLREQRAHFHSRPAEAEALVGVGTRHRRKELEPRELAPWTVVANLLLNLDESITKE